MLDKIAQPGALSIKARASFSGIRLGIICIRPLSFLTFPDYLVFDLIIVKKKNQLRKKKKILSKF